VLPLSHAPAQGSLSQGEGPTEGVLFFTYAACVVCCRAVGISAAKELWRGPSQKKRHFQLLQSFLVTPTSAVFFSAAGVSRTELWPQHRQSLCAVPLVHMACGVPGWCACRRSLMGKQSCPRGGQWWYSLCFEQVRVQLIPSLGLSLWSPGNCLFVTLTSLL
jgi:hypothetical protein